MPVMTGGNVVEGSIGPIAVVGAPGAGTSEIQLITIGGTPSQAAASSFRLAYEGFVTSAILWSSTNTSLVASIDAALEALPSIGTGNVTTAASTMTAGVGTITVTFAGGLSRRDVPSIVAYRNDMTGTTPTLSVSVATPGVDATFRGASTGSLLSRVDAGGVLYVNTSTTAGQPSWTVVGAQT